MDSNEVKKRFVNDVSAPVATKSAPVLETKKRQTIVVSDDLADQTNVDPLLPPSEYTAHKDAAPTSAEKVIQPPSAAMDEPTQAKPIKVASETSPVITEAEEPVPAPAELAEEAPKVAAEVPAVDPLPESVPEEQKEEPAEEIPEDKDEPMPDTFEASDALPDSSERAANEIKDGMQDPKLYDTTAYHVPIKETHHSHGGVKAALVFGALFALIVVGGAVYFMFRLGS